MVEIGDMLEFFYYFMWETQGQKRVLIVEKSGFWNTMEVIGGVAFALFLVLFLPVLLFSDSFYEISVRFILPLALTIWVVSACFREYKTRDLMLSLVAFAASVISGVLAHLVILVFVRAFANDFFKYILKNMTEAYLQVSVLIVLTVFIFTYCFIYKLSGFAHPIKRTFLIVAFGLVFILLGCMLLPILNEIIRITSITNLTFLIVDFYPVALMFLIRPSGHSKNTDNNDDDMPDTKPLQYRQVPHPQSQLQNGYMEHPQYPTD